MEDPRDKRFYQIAKKDKKQLTPAEINEYMTYCQKMSVYVKDKKAKISWNKLISELESLC